MNSSARPDRPSLRTTDLPPIVRLAFCFVMAATPAAASSSPSSPPAAPSDSAKEDPIRSYADLSLEELEAARPEWPNPFLSFLPADAVPDERYWRAVLERQGQLRAHRATQAGPPLAFTESEPNDTPSAANPLIGFGTDDGENPAADISGFFTAAPAPSPAGPFAEDDGSIPLASETSLVAGGSVRITGTIGDGPFGSGGTGAGDFDFFRIPAVRTGELLVIDVDTTDPMGDLDPFIALYAADGTIVALNEDGDPAISFDSFLALPAPFDGDYYLAIAGSIFPFASLLGDPFDSSTGPGLGSEGDYAVSIALENGDSDWYRFELDACDVLGVNLAGAGYQAMLTSPTGELFLASSQDLSGVYPDASLLPGGGRAVLAHVAASAGTYALRVIGDEGEPYALELRVFRPVAEANTSAKTLFIDFDGATVDPVIFRGPPGDTTLSPLSSFLGNWGLGAADEDAVIDGVLAELEATLLSDPSLAANDVVLLNSRDHADPFGAPGVARLIVGGSIGELGIPTIGIAQSIDPGNFAPAETGIVLLDLLSGSAPSPDSLNTIPLDPSVSRIDLVGLALGKIAAHEAGHLLGNFHTELAAVRPNVMDRGGNLGNTLGLGPDGIFGTADDETVRFGDDHYEFSERFAGIEDTRTVVTCGCRNLEVFEDGFESGDVSAWEIAVPEG